MAAEKIQRFRGRIEQNENDGGGAFVTVPFDVEQVFGGKRVKIKATINGIAYRGTLIRMGGDCHRLLVLKEIREKLGKQPGDEVDIVLQKDLEERTVEVPEDLQALLRANPAAEAYFEQLAYTYRKEYARWIEDAKREATRQQRLLKAIDMLLHHKKLS
ncbi:YdeI/OmpD-associated family protein [Undibacterium sp. TJN25]|uniref:YdeI/OmpD-associated family protein n=1 Tax=Undibacterium sp. TJN25 TaxID=3413056 RepID=UPI003BF1F783